MSGFFSMDGPFYKFGSILADVMILSFVWIFFSIPLFTIGTSTTALFYVMTRRISNREGYLMRDFWSSFKTNFKQSTVTWLIIVFVGLILYTNITQIGSLDMSPTLKLFLYPMQLVFFVELILLSIYIFPIIARFDMKLKDVFKTTVFMIHKHLLTTLMLAVLFVGVFLAGYLYPLFYVIAPGTFAYVTSYLFIKIFKKYRPEIDADPLEQLRENER